MELGNHPACPICLEVLPPSTAGGGTTVRTPCGHTFHRHCLREWYTNGNHGKFCPVCRYRLRKWDFAQSLQQYWTGIVWEMCSEIKNGLVAICRFWLGCWVDLWDSLPVYVRNILSSSAIKVYLVFIVWSLGTLFILSMLRKPLEYSGITWHIEGNSSDRAIHLNFYHNAQRV